MTTPSSTLFSLSLLLLLLFVSLSPVQSLPFPEESHSFRKSSRSQPIQENHTSGPPTSRLGSSHRSPQLPNVRSSSSFRRQAPPQGIEYERNSIKALIEVLNRLQASGKYPDLRGLTHDGIKSLAFSLHEDFTKHPKAKALEDELVRFSKDHSQRISKEHWELIIRLIVLKGAREGFASRKAVPSPFRRTFSAPGRQQFNHKKLTSTSPTLANSNKFKARFPSGKSSISSQTSQGSSSSTWSEDEYDEAYMGDIHDFPDDLVNAGFHSIPDKQFKLGNGGNKNMLVRVWGGIRDALKRKPKDPLNTSSGSKVAAHYNWELDSQRSSTGMLGKFRKAIFGRGGRKQKGLAEDLVNGRGENSASTDQDSGQKAQIFGSFVGLLTNVGRDVSSNYEKVTKEERIARAKAAKRLASSKEGSAKSSSSDLDDFDTSEKDDLFDSSRSKSSSLKENKLFGNDDDDELSSGFGAHEGTMDSALDDDKAFSPKPHDSGRDSTSDRELEDEWKTDDLSTKHSKNSQDLSDGKDNDSFAPSEAHSKESSNPPPPTITHDHFATNGTNTSVSSSLNDLGHKLSLNPADGGPHQQVDSTRGRPKGQVPVKRPGIHTSAFAVN